MIKKSMDDVLAHPYRLTEAERRRIAAVTEAEIEANAPGGGSHRFGTATPHRRHSGRRSRSGTGARNVAGVAEEYQFRIAAARRPE